jgi:sec-independent protein translocase protein TatA
VPGWIGPWELLILLLVILLIFGPKRLPEMGRSLGKGLREFKHSVTGRDERDEEPDELAEEPAELAAAVEDEPVSAARSRERDTVA